ncbi:MAG: AMP-binding protein [Arhodomonas sp.]|nr:AMP-binding protein [Arhodomonas sp.]
MERGERPRGSRTGSAVPGAQGSPRLLVSAFGGHRWRRPRPGHLQVLPGHGRAAAPALRPDRARRCLHHPSRDDIDYDTVGVPFDNAEVVIDNPDENGVGEIVARNSGMFLGFYKNEKATAEDVRDGWMYTGDAGYFKKENGHLVVIDRVKDLATTSHGDRYSPQFIENKLKFSPFIAEAVILGHERPYLAAMICIRYGIVAKWAEQRGISFTNYTNLSAQPQVYDLIQQEVEQVNASLPEWQPVRKFLLLYKELDPDDGELTRTRKVRRGVIQEKYQEIIDAIYGELDHVHVDTVITFQDGTTSRIRTDLRLVDLAPETGVVAAGGDKRAAGAA